MVDDQTLGRTVLPPERGGGFTLERLVVDRGLATTEALVRARLVRSETGEPLDSVLTRLGLVSEQALASALAEATGLKIAAAADFPAKAIATAPLSAGFLRNARAVPLRETETGVEVAFVDPLSVETRQSLAFALGREIRPLVARAGDVEVALDRLYPDPLADPAKAGEADESDVERLKDLSSDAPVVRAVNALISRAVEAKASDIHLEPTEDSLKIRIRIDGVLRVLDPLPPQMKTAFVSRIKVMAGLNIAERRLPQDGRLRLAVRGQEIDLRVATSPTIYGESVVMRILDRSNLPLNFEALGFDDATEAAFLKVLAEPYGIVLVTGPTGSGKTTTLYAALSLMNTADRAILSIEDPIEYRLEGINQTQVNPQIGLTFATALRSFLRQDPDVMMVGEIRDLETAEVAVQAALSGRGVLESSPPGSDRWRSSDVPEARTPAWIVVAGERAPIVLVSVAPLTCLSPRSSTRTVLTEATGASMPGHCNNYILMDDAWTKRAFNIQVAALRGSPLANSEGDWSSADRKRDLSRDFYVSIRITRQKIPCRHRRAGRQSDLRRDGAHGCGCILRGVPDGRLVSDKNKCSAIRRAQRQPGQRRRHGDATAEAHEPARAGPRGLLAQQSKEGANRVRRRLWRSVGPEQPKVVFLIRTGRAIVSAIKQLIEVEPRHTRCSGGDPTVDCQNRLSFLVHACPLAWTPGGAEQRVEPHLRHHHRLSGHGPKRAGPP